MKRTRSLSKKEAEEGPLTKTPKTDDVQSDEVKTVTASPKTVKAIVMDIEGTTTSISFVHSVLFPYARNNVEKYLRDNWGKKEVDEDITAIRVQAAEDIALNIEGTEAVPMGYKEEVIAKVKQWVYLQMDKDRKIGALKTLQGHIWEDAYKSGAVKGHLYKDAFDAIKRWRKELNIPLYIYSSGSIAAQKLLFGYSEFGNLLEDFSNHYDTTIGMKVEAQSYHRIADDIFPRKDGKKSDGESPNPEADSIVFLTDNIKEAEAAKAAHFRTALSIREGTAPLPEKHEFYAMHSFDPVDHYFSLKKLE